MVNDFLRGIKFTFGIIFTLFILFGLVYAVGFHSANEILDGTFLGNYKFTGNVEYNGTLNASGATLIGNFGSSGGVLIDSNLICNSTNEGKMKYNLTTKALNICNGNNWKMIKAVSDSFGSCKEILDAGASVGSGDYEIDPDGEGGNIPFTVFCEMDKVGGGWTRVDLLKALSATTVGCTGSCRDATSQINLYTVQTITAGASYNNGGYSWDEIEIPHASYMFYDILADEKWYNVSGNANDVVTSLSGWSGCTNRCVRAKYGTTQTHQFQMFVR